eukprot:CAMPEP_0172324562 /NCGR_PEP_ID=MMETSP1058-20130122/51659_1 /TAXON_ID=83371 /ORGANISM="Detonula confervacea, Strain CCMP 353" /LENGTH=494 /DNA_ID=CAMNT_0013040867 /DNA_START=71 /DNA_END=1555 /DNA_ORIENTATION=+
MSQAEFKKRLKALMVRPENSICSDCPERQPRWASLIKPPPGAPHGSPAMGAFCCLECSGSHRRLGVHISFVRSINLDQWKETEVLAMENGGNGKVNAIFEAHLTVAKPANTATGPMRERFIRDKYERRKYFDPSAFERVSQMKNEREREEVVNGVQRRLASSGSRKPSDAARKRVEERAARNRGGGGAAVRSGATRTVRTPAPAPAPAPVVDLLDFGNFDSPEATSAVQASVVASSTVGVANAAPPTAAPAVSNQEPELDLFANMSSGNNPGGGGGVNGQIQQQPGQQQQMAQPVDQSKMTNADIMSMFHAPSPAQQNNPMQPNMFAMGGGGGMPNGMAGGNNNMAMMGGQQMNPQQMGMTNNNMNPQQMGMMNNNNMNPQQQMGMMNNMQMMQQQQGMGNHMGGNNGNHMNMGMMGGQQGMGNTGGGNVTQQQVMQHQMNNNNRMMQGGGGGMMQGGNQFGQQSPMMGQAQQPQQGQQQRGGNQFADFGNFGR